MGQPPKDKALMGKTRWGDPIYTINPSVPDKQGIVTKRKSKIGNDRRGIIINDGTGEILGDGSATYYEFEEVDSERFVKLYLAGVKKAADLSKAGLSVFEWIYLQVMENPNTDRVNLSVDDPGIPLARTTFYRGLRELLDRDFLFRTPWEGTYFINVRYLFNGDRLAFVKGYQRKKAAQPKVSVPRIARSTDEQETP
jgi:hypothetical protein